MMDVGTCQLAFSRQYLARFTRRPEKDPAGTTEISVNFYHTARCNIPEDCSFNSEGRENLKISPYCHLSQFSVKIVTFGRDRKNLGLPRILYYFLCVHFTLLRNVVSLFTPKRTRTGSETQNTFSETFRLTFRCRCMSVTHVIDGRFEQIYQNAVASSPIN